MNIAAYVYHKLFHQLHPQWPHSSPFIRELRRGKYTTLQLPSKFWDHVSDRTIGRDPLKEITETHIDTLQMKHVLQKLCYAHVTILKWRKSNIKPRMKALSHVFHQQVEEHHLVLAVSVMFLDLQLAYMWCAISACWLISWCSICVCVFGVFHVWKCEVNLVVNTNYGMPIFLERSLLIGLRVPGSLISLRTGLIVFPVIGVTVDALHNLLMPVHRVKRVSSVPHCHFMMSIRRWLAHISIRGI